MATENPEVQRIIAKSHRRRVIREALGRPLYTHLKDLDDTQSALQVSLWASYWTGIIEYKVAHGHTQESIAFAMRKTDALQDFADMRGITELLVKPEAAPRG